SQSHSRAIRLAQGPDPQSRSPRRRSWNVDAVRRYDPDKRKEIMDKTKADRDAINSQIKDFVGDENYKQFETYEKTIPDRMSLSMYKDQQGSGPGALNPDQEAQLIQAMGEERQNFKFTTDFSDQTKFNGDFASYFTEDKINKFYEESDALNQHYLDR